MTSYCTGQGERSVRSSTVLLLTLAAIISISWSAPAPVAAQIVKEAAPAVALIVEPVSSPLEIQRGPLTRDEDLRTPSDLSAWGIDRMLAARTALPPLGASFLRAQREQRVNARFLLSVAMAESGWGRSWLAREKHNLFGFGALDRDPLRHAVRFADHAEGIAVVAGFLARRYLTPGGRYYHGATLNGVARKYAPAGSWAGLISRVSRALRIADPLTDYRWTEPTLLLVPSEDGYRLRVAAMASRTRRGLPALVDLGGRITLVSESGGTLAISALSRAVSGGAEWEFRIPDGILGRYTVYFGLRDSDGSPLPGDPGRMDHQPIDLEILPPGASAEVGADLLLAVRDGSGRIIVMRRGANVSLPAPELSSRDDRRHFAARLAQIPG